jgi:SAM-dependent methyltransferase
MRNPPVDPDAFNRFEHAAWDKVGNSYHRFWGPITGRAIDALLDEAGVIRNAWVLDIATGPGYAAARAMARGALVVGVDVAPQMVALAKSLHPGVEFQQGDAEHLPFPDTTFDAVVGNFVILHVGRPEQVVAECTRVLRPGKRLALSVWDVPEQARILGIFADAVREAGAVQPDSLPPGPPFFRFSADGEFTALLRSAGLAEVRVRRHTFTHRLPGVDAWWNGALDGAVRTTALVRGQTREMQQRIHAAFDRLARAYAVESGLEVPVSVKVASGRKPAEAQ